MVAYVDVDAIDVVPHLLKLQEVVHISAARMEAVPAVITQLDQDGVDARLAVAEHLSGDGEQRALDAINVDLEQADVATEEEAPNLDGWCGPFCHAVPRAPSVGGRQADAARIKGLAK